MINPTVNGVYKSKTTELQATVKKVDAVSVWYTITAFRGWCNCDLQTWQDSMGDKPVFMRFELQPTTSLEKWALI